MFLSQTIGLAWESPGMPVFQSTLLDFSTSHVTGGFVPSATPDAFGPRNDGQFCALVVMDERLTIENSSREIVRRSIFLKTHFRNAKFLIGRQIIQDDLGRVVNSRHDLDFGRGLHDRMHHLWDYAASATGAAGMDHRMRGFTCAFRGRVPFLSCVESS